MSNRCDHVGAVGYMREFPDFRMPQFEIDSYNQRFHDVNVIIDASATEIYYPQHWGGLSVKCAFNGSEHYRTNQTHYRVNDSSFLVFNEGNLYSSWIEDTKQVSSFTLNMTPSFERQATCALIGSQQSMIDDPSREGTRLRFLECLYEHGGDVTNITMKMRTLAKDLAANHLRLEELFFELFAAMNALQTTKYFPPPDSEVRPSAREELHQRMLRARDLMISCFQEDLTLSDISRAACLNKFHFLRQFKETFGTTPHQFLTNMRMKAACEQLANTEDPIALVSANVGYTDLSSFSKLVKRRTGHSPAMYRSMFQAAPVVA